MNNPNGPYPGRQLFLGTTVDGRRAFAYLVTGRSPASRERKATVRENSIIMGPLGDAPYDALRHYTAIKWDDATGVAAVTNGIQTEAVYETYRLMHNIGSTPLPGYLESIMEGAQSEPDSYNTPRIAGVVTAHNNSPTQIICIKRKDILAEAFELKVAHGVFRGISTYSGDMEHPAAFTPLIDLPQIKFAGKEAKELAEYVYQISEADYKGDDIRVCGVGGTWEGKKWTVAHVNRYQ